MKRISTIILLVVASLLVAWLCLGPDWSAPKDPRDIFNLNGSNVYGFLALLLFTAWLIFFRVKGKVALKREIDRLGDNLKNLDSFQIIELEVRGPATTHMKVVRL